MTASNYPASLKLVLKHEGGNVDHPKDPGGRTSRGITKAVYDSWRKSKGQALRDVFTATEAEVAAIYRRNYADKVRFDDLPAGLDYATFDGAVNSGVSRGAKWLQSALGVSSDGVVGAGTVAAATKADAVKTIKAMCAKRMGFLRGLSTFTTFGRGWTSRVAGVEASAVGMALSSKGASKSSILKAAAIESDVASKNSKSAATTSAGSGAASGGAASQADWSNLTGIESILLLAAAAGLVALAIYLIHRSRTQSARAEAYAAVASGELA
ncbi:glycoside hydrolase family 108 protein [Pararhizobium sp.]|uniref:glycoside hydrolase family 108 protein n=1 Tax=Pararhizobium sp. TaxID=1977563 RepID=UPI003D10276E